MDAFFVVGPAEDFLSAAFFGVAFLRVGVAVAGDFFAAFSAADFLPEDPFLPEDADDM